MNYIDRIDKAFENNVPKTPMTVKDSKILMSLLMSKDNNMNIDINELDKNSEIYQHFEPLINSFLAQIFLKRMEALTTLKMSLGALIMLLMYIDSPGNAVIYLYYLQGKLAPNTLVTLNIYSIKAFPWGVFNKNQLIKIWDAQKRKPEDEVSKQIALAGDNLLDYLETWKIQ
jgi:hypothetical protein